MKLHFFRVTLALFLAAWISNVSIAQETSTVNNPITKSGTMAMEFSFGGLNSMSFPGELIASFLFPGEGTTDAKYLYGAGAKYYVSDGLALRAILGFSTNTSGADSLTSGKTTGTLFGIVVGAEMHTHSVYAISPYFGAQIVFASGSSDNTKSVGSTPGKGTPTIQAATTTETKYSATGFGVGVVAGFDWYVLKSIALGFEYSLSFGTTSSSTTTGGTTKDLPASTSFGINAADLHLLIHL